MAIYPYRCTQTGAYCEIEAPMRAAPELSFIDAGGLEWVRDLAGQRIGLPVVRRPEVCHRGQDVPVSMSMPYDPREGRLVHRGDHLVREHEDGTHSTLDGSRIIDSQRSAEIHAGLADATRD